MDIESRLKTALDESRLLILGAQVLFGFQFEAVFQEREQCGQGSVREIRREMPTRQQRHGAAIDVRSHGAEASED